MVDIRPQAYSLAVRNLGEQALVLFVLLGGGQKLPPAQTHVTMVPK